MTSSPWFAPSRHERGSPPVAESAPVPLEEDVGLLRSAANGDWGSIGALYGRHRDSALAVAISVLADPAEAEDVVQDVFLDLPRMARSFDPGRGRPEQWLCRSVRNRAIDHVRRRARRLSRVAPTVDGPESLLALVPSRAASPTDVAEADEFLELLCRLDARHAHLVRLAFVDGWSHSAIARLTGLPLGTVKTRLRNSVRRIGEMLAEQGTTATPTGPAELRTSIGRLVVVSADATYLAAIERGATGIARSDILTWKRAEEESSGGESLEPTALVVDLATAETPPREAIERLARRRWDALPLLVRVGVEGAPDLPQRRGRTLVIGSSEAAIVGTTDSVRAVLTASDDDAIRGRAISRLMRSAGAFVAGDRLGRIRAVTPAAAALLGRSARQLEGGYVTDLNASGVADAERLWQHLAGSGRWTGASRVRRSSGPPVAILATAWLVPDGFVAALARGAVESQGAA